MIHEVRERVNFYEIKMTCQTLKKESSEML